MRNSQSLSYIAALKTDIWLAGDSKCDFINIFKFKLLNYGAVLTSFKRR